MHATRSSHAHLPRWHRKRAASSNRKATSDLRWQNGPLRCTRMIVWRYPTRKIGRIRQNRTSARLYSPRTCWANTGRRISQVAVGREHTPLRMGQINVPERHGSRHDYGEPAVRADRGDPLVGQPAARRAHGRRTRPSNLWNFGRTIVAAAAGGPSGVSRSRKPTAAVGQLQAGATIHLRCHRGSPRRR
jgi:hypothetical protein